MLATLQIEIGKPPFNGREISNDKIEGIIAGMLAIAGIDANLQVRRSDGAELITINGHNCKFPVSLVEEATACTKLLAPASDPASIDYFYWELIIHNAIWMQPQVLFPHEYLPLYMPGLNSFGAGAYDLLYRQCRAIIDEVLNLRIPLTDRESIREISDRHLSRPAIDWNDFREELIQSLASPEIVIYFNRAYFDEVITSAAGENLLELMRDGLFFETGIKYPPFKISFDDNLGYNAYRFKVNGYLSIPFIGLRSNQEILVNDTPERLDLLGIHGRATVNPANRNINTLIDFQDKERAEEAGFTTWGALGFFILGCAGFLRKYGYLCINKKFTAHSLERLNAVCPVLTKLVEAAQLLPLATKTLRLLAREEISIRNLAVILEAILETDYIIVDDRQLITYDERVPVRRENIAEWKNKAGHIVEFVRGRLKRYISHKYAKGQNTLYVYLLDPEIEKICDAPINPEENIQDGTYERVNRAVEEAISKLPPLSQAPVILTTIGVRPNLKKIIERSYPQVPVISYQELAADMSIHPLGRINLAEPDNVW